MGPTGPAGRRPTSVPRLRPYQQAIARAVIDSLSARRGLSFSVMIARQGGKNELSAQLELGVLLGSATRAVESVKTAPTFEPQLEISLRRLWGLCVESGLAGRGVARREGNAVRLGRAAQRYLSGAADAHVVGHTAQFLECDEAQDYDVEKWTKDFAPMGATLNATRVYYGTAWEEGCMLDRVKEEHLAMERRDGVKRHFEYAWEEVARYNPSYEQYVAAERERLGEEHPLFQTQYLLKTLAGAGRLFSGAARELLFGGGARERGRPEGEGARAIYVAGLDVGGEQLRPGAEHDRTVLSIARVDPPRPGALVAAPVFSVVNFYAWQGENVTVLAGAIAGILGAWGIRRLVVDATGPGEGLAGALAVTPGIGEIVRLRLTQEGKSRLGFNLQAAAGSGRLRLFGNDGSDEAKTAREECTKARLRLLPGGRCNFSVPESEGHDDYVVSLALVVEAGAELLPQVAKGRRGEGWSE